MSSTKTSRAGAIVSFILSGIFVIAAVTVFLNRQQLLDQFTVWSYEPTASIQTISDKVAFTDKGRFTFYATQPILASEQVFNANCPRQEVASPILGCYTSSDSIFIYDITNQQLEGMEEVTAVHEMLHAVWNRTDESERQRLGALLEEAYKTIENEELKIRMDYYARAQPGERANELHSILGSEVGSLPPALEAHYAQYFQRSTVLSYHEQYNEVYQGLNNRADELFSLIESLRGSIERRSEAYDTEVAQLSSDIASFNARANGGSFGSQSQFNSERASLVSRSSALDAERESINNDIASYNDYYREYQQIAEQIKVLNDSIDSFRELEEGPSV